MGASGAQYIPDPAENTGSTGGIVGHAWKVKDCQATAIVKGQRLVSGIAGLSDSISGCDFCGKVEEYEECTPIFD